MKQFLRWLQKEVPMSPQCLFKNYVVHFLLLCLLVSTTYGEANFVKCGSLNSAGWTVPNGDIFLEVGQSLEIFCILHDEYVSTKGFSSGNIVFYNGSVLIDQQFVKPVNDTTAKLQIDNLNLSTSMFYCKLSRDRFNNSFFANGIKQYPLLDSHNELVCLNVVTVGSKPRDVSNFTCISYNWEYMNVSWITPNNVVPTNYSVYYQIPRRGGRGTNYPCPNTEDIVRGRCIWSLYTTPSYRRSLEYLTFYVSGTNRFGNSLQQFRIHHFSHILPSAPQNLKSINKTVSSIYLSWEIGALHILEKGLIYKIEYAYNASWNSALYYDKDLYVNGEKIGVNISGLEHPNTPYDFRIYSKSSIAISDEFWSSPASLIVRTESCPPYSSPKTDIGSFEIIHETSVSRDVLIYWKALPELDYNGDDFHYDISAVDENKEISIKPELITRSYAKFSNFNFGSYRFDIRSINAKGAAKHSSTVYLPKKSEILPEPSVFTKIDYGDGIYELSWKFPDTARNDIVNFTTFWCESTRERPYQCNGFVDWIHVPAHITKHNFTINSTSNYQFAISANSNVSSSGMIWTSCTALHNQLHKLKDVWVNDVGSYYILVKWKLDCSERVDSIRGYSVNYCVASNHSEPKCIEPEKTLKIFGDATTMHANITNLRPFTNYKIHVSIFVKGDKVGPPSNEMVNRTLDGPPDVTGVKIEPLRITSTSVKLRWEPPRNANGILQYYKILYNDKVRTVNTTETTLDNLRSYTNYDIIVSACTLFCSEMDPITILTKIGTPGVTSKTTSEMVNSSHVMVKWNPPQLLAGPSPMYDVKIQFDQNDENSTIEVFETAQTSIELPIPNCVSDESGSSYTVYVRAKNTDDSDAKNNLHFVGEWSSAYSVNCIPDERSRIWKILGCITVMILMVLCLMFLGKKSAYKCKQMQDLDVTLPPKFINPTLFHNDSKQLGYHINIGSWGEESAERDHLNSKLTDLDQSSVDCIDMDLDTDQETDRSSSGCYTG